jgi:hypothetical protein
MDNLLNALNLFLNDSTQLPQEVMSKLRSWKNELDLKKCYTVFLEVAFKFFKNRRIDVLFASTTTALKFWKYYTLEIIQKLINEND